MFGHRCSGQQSTIHCYASNSFSSVQRTPSSSGTQATAGAGGVAYEADSYSFARGFAPSHARVGASFSTPASTAVQDADGLQQNRGTPPARQLSGQAAHLMSSGSAVVQSTAVAAPPKAPADYSDIDEFFPYKSSQEPSVNVEHRIIK